ncbi:MAG: hypothetical protein DRR16_02215 [Candidatus Parabeggiatoa sp. nov. 3]|nr:MAG: hypothetical protein DRR00_05345 [Gammaproteobacteria bacterium]RKZ57256.1 MAG: hypothetical protein DRQ99_27200 [Gammaproteobacteria bacterium]RKZ89560.1 MAG: hypothetical protein DRR16_02215 [Gammaproteobacteria bacterium]HEW97189.1 hypothetical protein [Beggiatoa sp.]
MDLTIPDKQYLHPQYIVDETGKKTALVISLNKFDEFFSKVTRIGQRAQELQKAFLAFSKEGHAHQAAAEEQVQSHHLDESIEQKIILLKQHYDLLNKILGDLRQYESLKTKLDRKLLFQRLIKTLDTEVQDMRRELGELKKHTQSATLHQVPELPNHFIKERPILKEVKMKLLAKTTDKQRPPIVIQAPSGMGKSALAAALARETEIRLTFPDGIFWHTLGADADLLAHQIAFIETLGESTTDILDIEQGTKSLREICATRACLLILDDVTDAQDILPFNLVVEHCQLLITSSDSKLLDITQYFIKITKGYKLKGFSEEQAVEFFINSVAREDITASSIPASVEEIVRTCDYSPLAIKLVAHVARQQSPTTWGELVERLEDEESEFPDKHPRALMQALQLNVEALGEPADYYIALAVFADYSHIPQSVAIMLWRYLYQLIDEEAYRFIKELTEKGLLHLTESDSHKYLSLHAFQHDYLCAEAERDKLHSHLLAIYRRQCDQHGWISGPNDGYFFEYLCMHLHHAGRHSELKLLLLDFDWMQNKLQATSIYALLNDYEWLENDKEIELIKNTLSESAFVLLSNKQELAPQLLDRLWENKSVKSNKDIQAILNQAQEAAPNWHWQPHFPDEKQA